MNFLEEVVKDVRASVEKKKREKAVKKMNLSNLPQRSLIKAIEAEPKVPVIAEVKRASPSAGDIRPNINPIKVAEEMVKGGACALSILTEPKYFKGDLAFISDVRKKVQVPLLRKDFIVDEYQIYESAEAGADVILLIVELLGDKAKEFMRIASELGMESLVEVTDKAGLKLAVSAGANLIGINNRNLRTLELDFSQTERLAPLVPETTVLVSESGINSPADVRRMLGAGADAVLVGTSVMRAEDIREKVKSLVNSRNLDD
jgi:indole-3-glycerol phosphate synthase